MKGNREMAEPWLEKVIHDIGSAKIIHQHLPDYHDTIAFHCQQAVEKSIKGILVYYGKDFKYSHYLPYLINLLSQLIPVTDEEEDKAILLNQFSVEIRYPNTTIALSEEDIINAIEIADYFMEKAIAIIRQ